MTTARRRAPWKRDPASVGLDILGRNAIACAMPHSQDVDRPLLDAKQDSVDAVAFAERQFADLEAEIFRLGCDCAPFRMHFERFDLSKQPPEPSISGGRRALLAKPAEGRFNIGFRLVSRT